MEWLYLCQSHLSIQLCFFNLLTLYADNLKYSGLYRIFLKDRHCYPTTVLLKAANFTSLNKTQHSQMIEENK